MFIIVYHQWNEGKYHLPSSQGSSDLKGTRRITIILEQNPA